jgi:hypothetical protein
LLSKSLVFRAIVVQQRFRKALLLHLLHMYLNECKNAHFAAAALIQIIFAHHFFGEKMASNFGQKWGLFSSVK